MTSYDASLLTNAEIRAFMDSINAGRAVYGEGPVETLDYDACEPGSSTNCLSAHYLAALAGGTAGLTHFNGVAQADELAAALGTVAEYDEGLLIDNSVRIPEAILVVTDLFDQSEHYNDTWQNLRDRLVEAGVVE